MSHLSFWFLLNTGDIIKYYCENRHSLMSHQRSELQKLSKLINKLDRSNIFASEGEKKLESII